MIQVFDTKIHVFRDDLFPYLGGGNKARKMMGLHPILHRERIQAIVTTGGIQSNHCRATAIYCKKHGLLCTLVLHGKLEEFAGQSGNARIMRDSGAEVVFCDATEISSTMDCAMEKFREQGIKPFYLPGGGHTVHGARAYIALIESLFSKENAPDYIFLPSGTGSTQAGIVAGLKKLGLSTKVIGISIGRKRERAEEITRAFYNELCTSEGIGNDPKAIHITDDYLCGGYEAYNDDMAMISRNSLSDYDFFLDTTYTGKAFYGMKEILKMTGEKEAKSLFWYTGGINNYLA